MKKMYYLVFSLFISLVFVSSVSASNKVSSIDVNIYINEDGSANVTEVWKAKVDNGTELYKPIDNLGNMDITNFRVKDENQEYTYVSNWNISGSLSSKTYKNGINYTSNGLELCWGMSGYGTHTYTISYTLSNFAFNTDDAQVVYYKAINDNMDPAPNNFSIVIKSFYKFADTLDVWGYGYDGYAYVKDGQIELANKENNFKSSEYAVALIKFPLNTFNNKNSYSNYNKFDDVLTKAKEGSTTTKNEKDFNSQKFIYFLNHLYPIILFFIMSSSFLGIIFKTKKYHFKDKNAKIKKEEIVYFRDIPVNKDFYKANTIAKIYMGSRKVKNNNIIGAILLKWILYDKVKVINLPDKTFSKNRTAIDLKDIKDFEIEEEKEIYEIMKEASNDNILEANELKNWSKKNYTELFDWIKNLDSSQDKKLVNEGYLTRLNFNRYNVSVKLKNDGLQVLGLEKFLKEFSNIKDRSAIDVKLWREYLIFAQIFGIADKVAKEFKTLIPDVFEYENYDVDTLMNNIIIINMFSSTSVSAAESARSVAANNYSGGGGGFSSFGGGGGSFGGGSGGGAR